MAKYTVTHTCGHTSHVELFGKVSERERRMSYMETDKCFECRTKPAIVAISVVDPVGRPRLLNADLSQHSRPLLLISRAPRIDLSHERIDLFEQSEPDFARPSDLTRRARQLGQVRRRLALSLLRSLNSRIAL